MGHAEVKLTPRELREWAKVAESAGSTHVIVRATDEGPLVIGLSSSKTKNQQIL